MTRRTATLLGALVAACAVVEVVVLSGVLAGERQDERARYDRALADQRRAAGRTLADRDAPPVAGSGPTTFCVGGVETFAATARAELARQGRDVFDDARRLDMAGFRALSALAVRGERYAERAHAGPALRQRMGRTRGVGEDGAEVWSALEPERRACKSGDAYAMFRLDVPRSAVTAPTKATPSATKRATKASKRRRR
jgi:hypothetical protein